MLKGGFVGSLQQSGFVPLHLTESHVPRVVKKTKALKRQSIKDHKGKQIPWKQQSLGQLIRFTLASLHIGYTSSFLGRPEFYIPPHILASLSPRKSNLSEYSYIL